MKQEHEITFEAVDSPEERAAFRVAIFGVGSESAEEDKLTMENARRIASKAIDDGFSIATGGYNIGVMRAATEAASEKLRKTGIENTGSRIKGFALAEKYTETPVVSHAEVKRSESLTERLQHLVDESRAFIVMGGNFGTFVELMMAIHSENVQRMPKRQASPKPIIIIDPGFELSNTLNFLVDRDKKLQNMETLKHIYFIAGFKNWEEKANQILEIYYKQTLDIPLTEDERTLIEDSNYKYNYEHYLDNLQKAGFHL